MEDLILKYDKLANGFAEKSYANLQWDMQRRFELAVNWGPKLSPGETILEIGCGDGYLAPLFLSRGYKYIGLDFSNRMIDETRQRLLTLGYDNQFELIVADANDFSLSKPVDALVSYMRTFFSYVRSPLEVLTSYRPYVNKKMIIDVNPRSKYNISEVLRLLENAHYHNPRWRPYIVPKEKRIPKAGLRAMKVLEVVPLLRKIPILWKFHCLILAET